MSEASAAPNPALAGLDDDALLAEISARDISFRAWDDQGNILATNRAQREECDCDHDDHEEAIASYFDLDEAVARLRRGDLVEALLHLERAIPALDGLHDAVRKLQR